MFSWVPLEYYTAIYFQILLVLVFISWIDSKRSGITDPKNLGYKHILGVLLVTFTIAYMGSRPVSGRYFVDMATYAYMFEYFANGGELSGNDIGFELYLKVCSRIMTVDSFFLLCAFLYVFPLYLVSKKLFNRLWYYAFLILVCSFSFWAYGVNGIRNGIATSLMLLALAHSDKKVMMICLMLIAVSFHKTMLLPVGAYLITLYYNHCKKFLYFWLLCIPISLIAGGVFESLFARLGFDERIAEYLIGGNVNDNQFSSIGFRWDFILYSGSAVFTGWYFIVKRQFDDKIYKRLFNVYLIANAFWILVIRANFSNRFAYLSWFLIGIIIGYPFLKKRFFLKQHQVTMNVIFIYFLFTYLMNVIL